MRIFKKSVYFLFESGSLDSPGGPSSNRRYSITGVLRRRVIMNFTSKGPAEAKSTITLRRIHLIRRPYAKRRGRRETMFDCPLSKTVKILDQRSCSMTYRAIIEPGETTRGRSGTLSSILSLVFRQPAYWRGEHSQLSRKPLKNERFENLRITQEKLKYLTMHNFHGL